MFIPVDPNSAVPLYQQVVDAVKSMVDDGRLPAGTRIPSSRELAEDLNLSRKTVLTAYQILIADHYIETRPQSGTFVVDRGVLRSLENGNGHATKEPTPAASVAFDWAPYGIEGSFFALPPQRAATTSPGDVISLVKAIPDPHLFPFDKIKQIAQNMVWNPKDYFFQYGHPQGFPPLVEHLEQRMALEGIAMSPGRNDIVMVAGFQQGLNLLTDLLCREDDVVIVEQPTFASILNLLIARRIRYIGIPVDQYGMQVDRLEAILKSERVKAIVTIPTCHNPTGTTMTLERREQLLALALKYQVPIIEDDYALDVRFDGPKLPSLKALDAQGSVLHIGSFSKSFMPGLRIGWITAPSEAALALVRLKRACDNGDSFFLQAFLHEFIKRGYYDQHVRHCGRIYQARRDALIEALERYLPPTVSFTRPQGGMSLWVHLPQPWKSLPIYHLALEEGVEIGVARFFWPDKQDASGFRLAYSQLPETSLHEAARRLGQAMNRLVEDPTIYKEYERREHIL